MAAGREARPEQIRPERLLVPVTGSAILLTIWAAVAHASGSEWVQALGALVAGMIVVGMVAPRAAVRRIRIVADEVPADAVSGEPFHIIVTASASCRVVPLRPEGTAVLVPAGHPVPLDLVPDRRGRLSAVSLGVSSAAPLGIMWWSGRCRVPLPRMVIVAPHAARGGRHRFDGTVEGEQDGRRALADHGELHSIREYRVGDSPRQVHWPSTAHAGTLMVRESDRLEERAVRIVADLSPDPAAAEAEACEVMGAVVRLLDRRRHVVLETVEDGRTVIAPVATDRDAGRRLARAGVNPWSDLGPGQIDASDR